MNQKKVIILGGGVAGMSAAHELVERGYLVEIYERNPVYVGGKARSVDYYGKNSGQRYDKPLPGEHGFRFFPGFYKHITDTMQRIPFNENGQTKTVFDNLISVSREMLARSGNLPPIITNASFPKTLADFKVIYNDIFHTDSQLTKTDIDFFAERIWQLMTSCNDRRNNDYERMAWWDYVDADNPKFSDTYRALLAEGLLHTLVAAKAQTASTKTAGNILLQLIFCMTNPAIQTDRVFNGPTNDRWLNAWKEYLVSKGVQFHSAHEATAIQVNHDTGLIESVTVRNLEQQDIKPKGDYYILAVPLERAAMLVNEAMIKRDPTLQLIIPLAKNVNWMNGIQFYLNQDVKINDGHIICSDSKWALTAFSQIQFWNDYDISKRGNGNVRGLISVDVSEWFSPGNFNQKNACDCTEDEVRKEVWAQLKMSLNTAGTVLLTDDMLVDWYLDRDITTQKDFDRFGIALPGERDLTGIPSSHDDKDRKEYDTEPLLVNNASTWGMRPNAHCGIDNLFFASDYVRTFTDLATMEGANEAARRAVNCLLNNDGNPATECGVWPLEEPLILKPLKWYDRYRWNKGLTWTAKIPFWLKGIMIFWSAFCLVEGLASLLLAKLYPVRADLKLIPRRTIFVLGSMAVAIGCLALAAWKFQGWHSAAWWGFGFSAIYLVYSLIYKDKLLMQFWLFAAAAGFTELLADNWLVKATKTLFYPFEPKLLSSPSYMPFSWIVVLMQIGYIAYLINQRFNLLKTSLIVGLLGCCIIPFYEFLAIHAGWWHYEQTPMLGPVPVYIIVAEGLLMLTIPKFFELCETSEVKMIPVLGILQGLVMWLACIIAFSIFG